MGILKKIKRNEEVYKKHEDLKVQRQEFKDAEQHPAVKHVDELIEEVEQMHEEHPEIKMLYKEQIDLIRNECNNRIDELKKRRKEVIDKMAEEFGKVLDTVNQDYKEKEFWTFMSGVEHERNELKNIITNHYGKEETNIEDPVE